ncbi:ABC transporter ATP-binding protein/permease [Dehalococcoidia bacterium]|nr:ABC transporter ATP-binding protein/permease [Dehalococcoidia bacterium]
MRTLGQFRYLLPAFGRIKGMLALAGLVTLSVSLIALLPPYLAKLVFDRGVATGDIGTIVLYGLLAIGAFLLSSVLDFAGDALSGVAGTRFTVNVKSQAIQRLLQMRLEFFDKHQSGYLAERLSEVQMLGQFVSPTIFQFLGSLIQFIGALVIMARISVEITIVPLLFVVPFYFITRKMSGSLKETSEELMETGAQMMGSLQEMIGGVAEVKQSTAEERKSHEAAAQFKAFGSQEIKQSIFMGLGMGSMEFLTNLVMVIVLILSGIFIVRGELSIGDYVALAGYVGRLFTPVQLAGMFILTIQPAMAALERLRPIFEEKTEREVGGKNRVKKLEGAISFNNVRFAYDSAKDPVLRGCSFSIAPAECVAILGKNGAGKSTVVKLTLGFYPEYDGEILIDGRNLRDYDVISLRRRVGIVSQNVVLFTGSLWDNVKMASPEASQEAVQRALAFSGCRDTFDGDLGKIDIAESGKTLSGGQRQAVAIARCLLKDPDVLIFDEATAHLDSSTRGVVVHALNHVFAHKTRVLITHDREIAGVADTVLFLEEGVVRRS